MKSILKKMVLTSLFGFVFFPLYATSNRDFQYVVHYHNIESLNSSHSDKTYEDVLREPLWYQIKDDKPVYKDTALQKNRKYKRLSTTHISPTHQLFFGQVDCDVTLNNKPTHLTGHSYFILDRHAKMIQGAEVVPGHYRAQFIGVDQTKHTWPSPPEPSA